MINYCEDCRYCQDDHCRNIRGLARGTSCIDPKKDYCSRFETKQTIHVGDEVKYDDQIWIVLTESDPDFYMHIWNGKKVYYQNMYDLEKTGNIQQDFVNTEKALLLKNYEGVKDNE